LRSVLYTAI